MTTTPTSTITCDAALLLRQIGPMALGAVGARNILDLGNGIRFKAGRGNRWFEITLNASDLFDLQVVRMKRGECTATLVDSETDVFADQLAASVRRLERHLV